jgi:diamine N-acetyltransferase
MSTVAPDAQIMLRELTADNLQSILELQVAESQRNLVAPNPISVSEAYVAGDHAWVRGVYTGDTPVGFLMLYTDPDRGEYHVWRLMIAEAHQRKGYGTRALERVIEHVRTQPNARELTLCVVPAEGGALDFYRRLGFAETGEMEEDELVMRLDLSDEPPERGTHESAH